IEVGRPSLFHTDEQNGGGTLTADGLHPSLDYARDLFNALLEIALRGRQRSAGSQLEPAQKFLRRNFAQTVEIDVADLWGLGRLGGGGRNRQGQGNNRAGQTTQTRPGPMTLQPRP